MYTAYFFCFSTYILEENGYIFVSHHQMHILILIIKFFGVWFSFLFFNEDTIKKMQHTWSTFTPCTILYFCFVEIKRRVFEIFTYSKGPGVRTTIYIKHA